MSDTPIAEQVAAELGMPWPPHHESSRPADDIGWPTLEDGYSISGWFTDSGDGGSPEGCGPVPPRTGPHPPNFPIEGFQDA
jgi:hypothetical protein